MIRKFLPFGSSSTDAENDTQSSSERTQERHEHIPELNRFHKDLIAPTGVYEEEHKAKVGNHHVKTFFIGGWPDEATRSFLDKVLMDVPVENDITLHFEKFDSETIVKKLGRKMERSKARLQSADGGLRASQRKAEEFEETREIYNELKNGDSELFDVGMYVTIRGETVEELQDATDKLLTEMRSAPALIKPIPLTRQQLDGFQSVAPVGDDEVGHKTEMMSGALGAMLPFSSKSIIEASGVDFGIHSGTGAPVVVNRWGRQNGYIQFTFGKIGSGKSYSTKLGILRQKANDPDTLIFMLDPVGPKTGFGSICTALQGKHVVVGGRQRLNPLEIRKTPEDVLKRSPDIDPYAMTKDKAMDFFEQYFAQRDSPLGESRGVLEHLLERAYAEKGITRDIETHNNESPTVADVITLVEELAEHPETYADVDSPQLQKDIEKHASRLLMGLQQFKPGGEYENLAYESTLDIRDEEVVYFDLSQQEATGSLGLMMSLLFAEVYQIAKETDKNVYFALDEAHYLFKDAQTLAFLETVVRHSRHINLSLNFITQTIEEFFAHDSGRTIAQNASIKLFHRTESGLNDDIAKTLDLNPAEINYIRNAQAGDPELGYSDALLGVGSYGYVPLQVIASDYEDAIINYDPADYDDETIPTPDQEDE